MAGPRAAWLPWVLPLLLAARSAPWQCPLTSPRVDGQLSAAEWRGARAYALSNGQRLYLLTRPDTLYVGLPATAPGWAHVYLAGPDSVWVLHASAALGQQLYVRGPRGWQRRQVFRWELRAPAAAGEQARYFRQHGWSASVSKPGQAADREFGLRRAAFRSARWLSVVYATAADPPAGFPARLRDDTRRPALLRGGQPDTLQFQLRRWHRLPRP